MPKKIKSQKLEELKEMPQKKAVQFFSKIKRRAGKYAGAAASLAGRRNARPIPIGSGLAGSGEAQFAKAYREGMLVYARYARFI